MSALESDDIVPTWESLDRGYVLALGRVRDPKMQFIYGSFHDFFFWHAHAIRVPYGFWAVT